VQLRVASIAERQVVILSKADRPDAGITIEGKEKECPGILALHIVPS
jgi:hypothetical protein